MSEPIWHNADDIRQIVELEVENKSLKNWKIEQLAVEAAWDVQAVGKLIGCKLGTPVRPEIEPYIKHSTKRITELESQLRTATAALERIATNAAFQDLIAAAALKEISND